MPAGGHGEKREEKGARGSWEDPEASSNPRNVYMHVRKEGPSQLLTPGTAPDFITPDSIQLPTPDYSARGQLTSLCASLSSHPVFGDVELRESIPTQVGVTHARQRESIWS